MYNKQVQIAPGVCLVNTLSTSLLVPHRDQPCTQWVSFNGDNEPVLNNAPEVDDGCDTFLKRLQRAKLSDQSDTSIPAGQQFCFEAVVDKRYNRWKRRRRKKISDVRRSHPVPASDSSEDNEDKNLEMEKILDRMYEKIHGPAPKCPNGSRDTPRMRNRKQREHISAEPGQDGETTPIKYEASSEWTSSNDRLCNSSMSDVKVAENTPSFANDGGCSWQCTDEYRQEITDRLKESSPDDLTERHWLPETRDQFGEIVVEDSSSDEDLDQLDVEDDEQDNEEVTIRAVVTPRCTSSAERSSPPPQSPSLQGSSCSSPKPTDPQSLPNQRSYPVQYSEYSKWSRQNSGSQRRTSGSSLESKPGSYQRHSSAVSWTEKVQTSERFHQSQDPLAQTLKPVQHRKETLRIDKNQKEIYTTKKQTINLPSLGKNAKGQTVPSQGQGSIRQQKRRISLPRNRGSQPQSQSVPEMESSSGEPKSSHVVPEFMFKDYYLRSLYGHKSRFKNYRVSDVKLKKTLTVDSLDIGVKPVKKKYEAPSNTPSNISFTRSFTFSMFDLPNFYKSYNTELEKKAKSGTTNIYN